MLHLEMGVSGGWHLAFWIPWQLLITQHGVMALDTGMDYLNSGLPKMVKKKLLRIGLRYSYMFTTFISSATLSLSSLSLLFTFFFF